MNVHFDDSRHNALHAMQAIHDLRDGETLCLEPGTYHFWPDEAAAGYYHISNNDCGYKYTAFLLKGRKNVTIDGCGAELIFHGSVCPFILDGCENVTIRNLSVDYHRPYYSQAEIVRTEENFTDLRFDPKFPVRVEQGGLNFYCPDDGWQTGRLNRFLVTEFDAAAGVPSAYMPPYLPDFNPDYHPDFLSGMVRRPTAEQRADGTIRLNGIGSREHVAGNWWVATHAPRDCPGVLIHGGKNLLLEDLTLYHTQSMGVVGQFAENITLRRVRAVPRPDSGRLLSVSADATHFVHCTGLLELDECTFTHMLDDAFNVHGNYTAVERRLDSHTLLVRFGHNQHYGLPLYQSGDALVLVDQRSMQTLACLTLASAEPVNPVYTLLRFDGTLPAEAAAGTAVGNYERMPEVYIHDCVTGWNRPRGLLISTGKRVRIARNRFFNMSHAIHFTGDAADWFESGPSTDVEIADNDFDNSAYTGGPVIAVTPHITEHVGPYHRNIRITGNRFRLADPRFLYAEDAARITMRNNTFLRDTSLPHHDPVGENGIVLQRCEDCCVEPPVAK